MHTTHNPELALYLSSLFSSLRGWCYPQVWEAVTPLADTIAKSIPSAPLAEIGVYHGKFFIGLVKSLNSPRNNYAFDVFEDQQFNLDRAGKGSREAFLANLERCGIPADTVHIKQMDSTWLTAADLHDIRHSTGGFAFFSVDGCHTAQHTYHDLQVAMALTHPQGIIFLDDYYNEMWPGVQEGTAKLFLMGNPMFVPLVYIANKLLFCSISHHEPYLKLLRTELPRRLPEHRVKITSRFGHSCLSVAKTANFGLA